MDIALRHVTRRFGTHTAVDDLSFAVGAGITGFLGPNGAGKSTTMRMLAGVLRPTTGEIALGGSPAWPTTPRTRALVGYLPEHNSLYTDMYVREYLRFLARLHGLSHPHRRVEEAIAEVGLGPQVAKRISELSKGYRQRVGLAQAVLHDPAILILDEPISGLDPNQLTEIRALIRRLGRTKVVLLSTHILQEVQALCERVLIVDDGRLVADTTVAALGERRGGETCVYLSCARPPDPVRLRAVAGVSRVVVDGGGARVFADGARDVRAALAQLVVEAGWGLLELRREATDVQDVFRELTARE